MDYADSVRFIYQNLKIVERDRWISDRMNPNGDMWVKRCNELYHHAEHIFIYNLDWRRVNTIAMEIEDSKERRNRRGTHRL